MIVRTLVGRLGWVCALSGALIGSSHLPVFKEPRPQDELRPQTVEVGRSIRSVRFDFTDGSFRDLDDRVTLHVKAMAGGELTLVSRGQGWAVAFPEVCDWAPQDCPRVILESDPVDWLNPGTRPIRWGASVRLTPRQVSDGSNVLQKGLSAAGTQFKLQVDGRAGQPSCVLAGQVDGQHRIFVALAQRGVADGRWHELECERDGTSLRLTVDGQRVSEMIVPTALSIVNDLPLRLGGKGVGPYNDQFHGRLDDVFVEIG